MFDLELRGGGDLKRISRELRGVDNREVKKQFSRELRAAAKPLVPAVRAAIMAIPTKGTGHTGLRRRMAKATRLQVRTSGRNASVTIRVDGRKMPDGEGSLPAYMEGTKPRWRHPVYGDRDTWVTQDPHPYFYKTVRPLGLKSRQAVNKAIDSITKQIT